tara:strand:+ start:155 stop:697 length:543 start_codon:yes stop_codon:yes gene_type:complete
MSFAKDCNSFSDYNDFYTTEKSWSLISHLIPKNKIIYECCMLNSNLSKSPQILHELTGNKVLYDTKNNFLEYHPYEDECDIIITNPPFSPTELKKDILKKLLKIDKPFIIILNSTNIFTKYFREIFKNVFDKIQIIVPSTKPSYYRLQEDNTVKLYDNMGFYSIYVAYKLNIDQKDLFVN